MATAKGEQHPDWLLLPEKKGHPKGGAKGLNHDESPLTSRDYTIEARRRGDLSCHIGSLWESSPGSCSVSSPASLPRFLMPGREPGGWIVTILARYRRLVSGRLSRRLVSPRARGRRLQPAEPGHGRRRRARAARGLSAPQTQLMPLATPPSMRLSSGRELPAESPDLRR